MSRPNDADIWRTVSAMSSAELHTKARELHRGLMPEGLALPFREKLIRIILAEIQWRQREPVGG